MEYTGLKYWLSSCYSNTPGTLEDWSELYRIDRKGNIIDKDGVPVIPRKGSGSYKNYFFVNLVRGDKTYKRLVHRCVASTYNECGEYGDKYLVDHINSNPEDNRVENLRWVKDQKENMNNPETQKKIKAGRERERARIRNTYLGLR